MSRSKWLAMALGILAMLLVASSAAACPACAGREADGPGFYVALASMILFPFMVVAVAFPVIRRLDNGQSKEELS